MRSIVLALVAASCSLAACGSNDAGGDDAGAVDPLRLPDGGPSTADAAFDVTPAETSVDCKVAQADGSICSCTEIGQTPPVLYLVLDRSASMTAEVAGTKRSKWSVVRTALLDQSTGVLRKLGSRVRVAMSWFPSPDMTDACKPGREILAPTIGSKSTYDALDAKLASALPRGATPTAATLSGLRAEVAKLDGPVHILLATDGAPNCGTGPCDAASCTYNLEGPPPGVMATCDATTNCCDPGKVSGGMGWGACIDGDATQKAVSDLVATGAKVWVVGVPGTIDAYATQLDALAVAGGTARDGDVKYWNPKDPDALTAALSSIAAKAIDSCTVRLDAPVPDPGVTNVLLDGEPVPQDATEGWRWTSTSTIELSGAPCTRIQNGEIGHVQVVIGCKTITR